MNICGLRVLRGSRLLCFLRHPRLEQAGGLSENRLPYAATAPASMQSCGCDNGQQSGTLEAVLKAVDSLPLVSVGKFNLRELVIINLE